MARLGRAFPIQARIGAAVLAPIQIVNAQSTGVGAPTAGTTGVTVTKPTGLADGDVMYAFVSRTDFANTAAWTCSGWTDIGPAAASAGLTTGNDTQTTILRKVVTSAAGEPSNYTFVNTQATTYQSIGIIVALRGVDTTTPEDIAVPAYGFTANTINPASLNATSASNNAFVIAYMQQSLAAATSGTGGAPSGYMLIPGGNTFATAGGTLDNKAYTAYKTLGTAGATTGTAVWTNATDPGTAESLAAVVLVRPMLVVAPVTGTLNITLGDVTSAASGGPLATGTLTETLDDLTSAAAGASGASGTLAVTLDNATTVAAGATGVSVLHDLQGWWDASQESYSNGDPVGTFTDRSGNGRNLTGVTTGRPTFTASAFPTGLAGLTFDGVNDQLDSASAMSAFVTASAFSVFVVVTVDSISTNGSDTYDNDAIWSDGAGGFVGLHLKSSGPTLMAYNWDGTDDHADLTIATGVPYVIHQRHEAGNIYVSVNGGAETSVASGNTTSLTATLRVGLGSSFYAGKFGEIRVYNVALSTAEIAATNTEMQAKWTAVAVTGTLAETLDNATSAASGTSAQTGTVAVTLANATSAAVGASGAAGTVAATLGAVTSAAAGTFTPPSVTGTLAETLDNVTSAAAGSSVTGTVARTLADLTCAASGTFTTDTVTGTVAVTLANTTSDAAGSSVAGTTAQTLANATLVASGASGASGALAETLDNATLAASGTAIVPVTGTLAVTLADVTSAASGTAVVPVTGTLAVTLENVTAAATGIAGVYVGPDPHPAKCTIRRQRFTRRLRYHRYAERPAVDAWALNIFNELIDFSDPEYRFTFRIGSVDTAPVLEKQTNIYGAAGAGTEHDGTPNITILWEPGELDIEPGMYQCQLIGTLSDLDEVFHGIIHIS